MNHLHCRSHRPRKWLAMLCLVSAGLACLQPVSAGIFSQKQSFAPKWGRFEQEFRSATEYPNPLEDATLTVVFTSPLGETFKVNGFWDGHKTWRVRFSPNFPGEWKFHTTCSDASNKGLNNVDGQFVCTVAGNVSAFDQHGPVRVARDKRHFEHDDHTAFFWLADTAGDEAIRSTPKEWQSYAVARAAEKFSAIRWTALPESMPDASAVTLNGGHLQINPEYFRKLDAKAEALNNAGLLDAITPFTKNFSIGTNLVDTVPDEQGIALLRYIVSRWDAYDVAWVLPCDDARPGRWKRIGSAVFGGVAHSPVVMNCGTTFWMLDELRAESWADALGYQCSQETNDDALQWIIAGPMTKDWVKPPTHPLLNLALPCVNEAGDNRVSADVSRRAAYWSQLGAPLAGLTCNRCEISKTNGAIISPNSASMGILASVFSSIDFWRLRPAPELLANTSSSISPMQHIAAARSAEGDLAVVYVPQNQPVELNAKLLPASPTALWVDARTGQHSSAPFKPTGATEKVLPPQGCADWLVIITSAAK